MASNFELQIIVLVQN